MKRRQFISLVGGVAAWPTSVFAQDRKKKYRIAYLSPSSTFDKEHRPIEEFFKGLRAFGYIEGDNLSIERFSTNGDSELRPEIARKAVSGNPDAIFAITAPIAQHVMQVSATIPIVGIMSDPIAFGLATDLARPSGNLTGTIIDSGVPGGHWGKKLQLLF